jgi:uncharacterized membrane protein
MTVTDVRPVGAIPAGWYPDPVDPAGLRWWSGENWTEHTSAPQPVMLVQEPVAAAEPVAAREPVAVDYFAYEQTAVIEPLAPDLGHFSRDPLVTGQPASVSVATMDVARRKDPYRDRNVISGIALVVAVIGLLAFVAGQLLELPDMILYMAGGTPFTIATVAIVVAIRTGRGLMLAVIAAVLSIINIGMVMALGALEAKDVIGTQLQNSPTFEQVLEQTVVEQTNTLVMPGLAVAADCPDVPTPAKGAVIDCTVTLDNGDSYLVHVTSEDGLGGMSFELVDVVIGNDGSAS